VKKINVKVEGNELKMGLDYNEDGENLVDIKLNLTEGIEESFKREAPIEGAKLVEFKFEDKKMKLVLDTDKDGEKLLELSIDIGEAFDEIPEMIKKK
jgi:hypothetical protein